MRAVRGVGSGAAVVGRAAVDVVGNAVGIHVTGGWAGAVPDRGGAQRHPFGQGRLGRRRISARELDRGEHHAAFHAGDVDAPDNPVIINETLARSIGVDTKTRTLLKALDIGFEQITVRRGYYPDHNGREDALLLRRAQMVPRGDPVPLRETSRPSLK